MSTAHEIELRMEEALPKLLALANEVGAFSAEFLKNTSVRAFGREIGARRARKLRRLGHDVRFFSKTSTGRARYKWLRVPAWSFTD